MVQNEEAHKVIPFKKVDEIKNRSMSQADFTCQLDNNSKNSKIK